MKRELPFQPVSPRRTPNCALWWEHGQFWPFWFGFIRTADGRGGMVWIGRLHFGWQF